MEKVIKKVVYSATFYSDLKEIYLYGKQTFGERLADFFLEEILHSTHGLSFLFDLNPECRFLETKTRIYRNIILGKYLIFYRIRSKKIEVLSICHGSQSPAKIKLIKKIKIT